jgi:glyoxylase-like metal-dependent hydrolase (beta-lactamase superfamily II)
MSDEPTTEADDTAAAAALTPAELHAWLETGRAFTLLDTRNADEIEQWRIDAPNSRHVPYSKFLQAQVTGGIEELVDGATEPYVAVCPRGEASDEVAAALADSGFEAYNLAGGMHGWARLYQATDLPGDALPEGVTVTQYRRPSSGCLAYLVVAGDEAAVVDPLRAFAERYAADAEHAGATLRYALDTHVHADHVSGVRDVARLTGAEPVLPRGATDRGLAFDATLVAGGDSLPVGDCEIEVVDAPGHTTELVAYRIGDTLLTGDTVFTRSVARPDLEAGAEGAREFAATLHETLTERFGAFDDDLLVAPGHYADESEVENGLVVARLGELRDRLPAFGQSEAAFVDRVTADMPPRPANYETIIPVNLGRETADSEAAFELELGPNNCAATAD